MIHDLFAALSRARLAAGAGTLLFALFARPTYGFHLDVVVGASGGTLTAGFCAAAAAGCDGLAVLAEIGLPPGTIPLHGATGQPIFVTDFGDFAGGPFATDNPGFFAGAGALPANLLLRYEITGFLQYWDPALGSWGRATPNGERIRLAGGFAAEAGGSCGLLVCFTPGSTVITTTGVSGAPSLIIDQTAANGSLHTHLDWFLELPSGTRAGAAGAYLLELRMAADSMAPSSPLAVLFNRGLTNTAFGSALLALINATPPTTPGDGEVVIFPGGNLHLPSGLHFDVAAQGGGASEPFTLALGALTGSGSVDLDTNHLHVEYTSDGTFDGRIRGAGGLRKTGSGRLNLLGINTYAGDTRVSGPLFIVADRNLGQRTGTLHLDTGELAIGRTMTLERKVLLSGENVFDTRGHTLTVGGELDGAGRLEVVGGGTLVLVGFHRYAGAVDLQQSALDLRGFLAGGLHLGKSAALVGHGDIGGDLTLGAGSVLHARLTPQGLASGVFRTHGRLRLEQPTLALTAASGDYPLLGVHTLLEAGQGVRGRFGTVRTDFAFLEPSLVYRGQRVLLHVARNDRGFGDFATDAEQHGVAQQLDQLLRAPRAATLELASALGALRAPEVEDALRAVSGVALTGLPRAGRAQSASVQRQVALRLAHVAVAGPLPALGFNADPGILLAAAPGRLDDPVLRAARGAAANAVPRPSHGIWLRGFAGVGAHDIDRQTRADSDHLGLVGGYDHRFTAALTAGLFASYTDSELNQPRPQASSSVRAWQLGAYGRLQHASWHVDGLFGYGGSSTDTSRRLLFGETLRHATASIEGETLNTYLEAAYTFDTRLVLQPYLALAWTRQSQDGYRERGAGVLGLELDAHDVDSVRTLVGLRVRHELARIGTGAVLGELRAAWAHEFADERGLNARLLGAPPTSTFVLRGARMPRDTAVLGAGLVARLNEHAQAFADFDGELDGGQHLFLLSAGVRIRW